MTLSLNRANNIARNISHNLVSESIRFDVYIVGSIRRKEQRINDIDLLIVTPRYINHVFDKIDIQKYEFDTIQCGDRRCILIVNIDGKYIQCDLFYATSGELPFALLHYTGSSTYLKRIRYKANLLGYKLNQYGLFISGSDKKVSKRFTTEKDILSFLDLTPRNPHERI